MSPYEPLQPDIRTQRSMCIVDTRTIALIASKKNFNPDKERKLIEKTRHTVCKCRHFTGTEPCLYRSCRHFADTHYKVALDVREDGKDYRDYEQAEEIAARQDCAIESCYGEFDE
jgi:hypothetical protein